MTVQLDLDLEHGSDLEHRINLEREIDLDVHLDLTDAEQQALRSDAQAAMSVGGRNLDGRGFVDAARAQWEHLPVRLRQRVREFRRDSGASGTLLLSGMPIDHMLPPTPTAAGSVRRTATVASAGLALIALGLGEPIAYAPEKSGALVQDVVPVASLAASQSNGGSVVLTFHTENAFHPNRPDYVLLLCLRPDPERTAALRVSSIRRALPLLDPHDVAALSSPWYLTGPPPSFGSTDGAARPHPVLNGSADDPDVTVDFNSTRAIGPRAATALARLGRAMDATAVDVRLRPGDLAVVDNRIAVHGRSGFQPAYSGQDRWLHRMFVQIDLRRSRAARPGDGYVLEQ
jgi:L-asparagine oxygenase